MKSKDILRGAAAGAAVVLLANQLPQLLADTGIPRSIEAAGGTMGNAPRLNGGENTRANQPVVNERAGGEPGIISDEEWQGRPYLNNTEAAYNFYANNRLNGRVGPVNDLLDASMGLVAKIEVPASLLLEGCGATHDHLVNVLPADTITENGGHITGLHLSIQHGTDPVDDSGALIDSWRFDSFIIANKEEGAKVGLVQWWGQPKEGDKSMGEPDVVRRGGQWEIAVYAPTSGCRVTATKLRIPITINGGIAPEGNTAEEQLLIEIDNALRDPWIDPLAVDKNRCKTGRGRDPLNDEAEYCPGRLLYKRGQPKFDLDPNRPTHDEQGNPICYGYIGERSNGEFYEGWSYDRDRGQWGLDDSQNRWCMDDNAVSVTINRRNNDNDPMVPIEAEPYITHLAVPEDWFERNQK